MSNTPRTACPDRPPILIDRATAHKLNNYLAVATTNAELVSHNLRQKQYDKLENNARLISDNLFKISDVLQALFNPEQS